MPIGKYGTVSAADIAGEMRASLPNVRIILLVGIGAVIHGETDILLKDVEVSSPDVTNGGVIQYDLYKAKARARAGARANANASSTARLEYCTQHWQAFKQDTRSDSLASRSFWKPSRFIRRRKYPKKTIKTSEERDDIVS